jgi:isopenicillin-N epimerase
VPTSSLSTAPFGRHLLAEWQLDPEITYLNHGTVGATPRRVLVAQRRIQDEVEWNPSRFLLRELSAIRVGQSSAVPGRLRQAADEIGPFIGAAGKDLGFVDNATAGVNAVLHSLDLRPGDEIVITDLAYGAVLKAAAYTARQKGAEVIRVEIPYPVRSSAEMVAVVDRALTPRTRMAIVDHVTSETALVVPLAAIAERCHARGILVLADGAHAPGSIALDLGALGVDFYAANLHKWAWAPRSCGILWAAPAQQPWLHPPVISWGLDQGFTTEFDCVGTRDPSPWLAAPVALQLMAEYGFDRVRAHNHALAWRAGTFLSERWGTVLDVPEAMVGTMVAVPLPERYGSRLEDAARLRDALLFEDRIEVQVHAWRGRLWVRVSLQIYNDMEDVERLARAVQQRDPR